jgi:hypothetical protein
MKTTLKGTVLKYTDPIEPVAEDDWEALDNPTGGFMAIAKLLERTQTFEVSPEQGLTIPTSVLAKMGFEPGQKFVALVFQDSIRLIPLVTHEEARGSMPGLDKLVDSLADEEQE